jgi:hypothetical protein
MYPEKLREVEPYLRSLGIKPDDKVISLPDFSFDITLYFMNQVGWDSGFCTKTIKRRLVLSKNKTRG